MIHPTTEQYEQAREKVYTDLKNSAIGGDWNSDQTQHLNFDPLSHFVSGILFPLSANADISSHEASGETGRNTLDSDDHGEDESEIDTNTHSNNNSNSEDGDENPLQEKNIIDQSTQFKQSSFGINFITSIDEEINVSYGFSQYKKKQNAGDNNSQRDIYEQSKFKDNNKFKITADCKIKKHKINEDLLLRIDSRKSSNKIISTVSISHQNEARDTDKILLSECYFQVGIKIETINGAFLPIHTPLQSGSGLESKSLDLLFRKKLSYSTGNGCATDWEDKNDVREVWTEFLPTYEVKSIEPTSEISLDSNLFANINNEFDESDIFERLDEMTKKYADWIQIQEDNSHDLNNEDHIAAAGKHIKSARSWLKRISEGIKIIKKDQDAFLAFRLTNYAMLIQFNRLNFLESKKFSEELMCKNNNVNEYEKNNFKKNPYNWRPFQLAFILGMIDDIVNPDASDNFRDQVDLIWFPTGGGKTEAYLGVIAFSIIYRRLLNPDNAGVTAIMRYTLRLLTADQFRRSASLICALEYIRENKILGVNLGSKMISIGLWIGSKGNPNTHQDAAYALNDLDRSGNQKFMLDECPWCKTHMTDPNDSGYERRREKKVFLFCPDEKCLFNTTLPVFLWQESIFEEKPTLLLGTIDNFAKMAWTINNDPNETLDLFHNNQFSPPELIIQDELHLISGPLGSMVGIYETVLLKLLEKDGKKPKIIGATATLSLGGSQTKNLYMGRESSIFPPQVLDWGDSFFAKEKKDKYGRKYVGFFGSKKGSMIESSFSASIPLLQAPNKMLPVLAENANKGDIKLKTKGAKFTEGNSFSIYHGDKFTEYEIISCEDVENDYQLIEINPPFEKDLAANSNRDTLFKKPDINDTVYDPYGTLVWYFNSKRELAYISNQTNRMQDSTKSNARYQNHKKLGPEHAPSRFARKIKKVRELTGRLTQDEIKTILVELNHEWTQVKKEQMSPQAIDIVFCTNMISVGVDIPRLGLMLVHGQPRTTSEYIQASSRVGRRYPGLVVTVYNHARSKDRSIYESFKNYHQSFYKYVESVSLTPFSSGARDRALPAIFIALAKHYGVKSPAINDNDLPALKKAKDWILTTVSKVDDEEHDQTEREIDKIIRLWRSRAINDWGRMRGRTTSVVLMGDIGEPENDHHTFKAPMSMRSVDSGISIEFHRPEESE